MRTRCVSLDYLYEKEGFEPSDNSKTGEESYFEDQKKNYLLKNFTIQLTV